jgi:hypothetical protein
MPSAPGAQVYVYHVGSRKIVARLALHKGIVRALVGAAQEESTLCLLLLLPWLPRWS